MPWESRTAKRVTFAGGLPMTMMSADGTWHRPCRLLDVSTSGARLQVVGSIEGLNLSEFFLRLSSTGQAFRRCELIRVEGDEIGVQFHLKDRIGSAK